MHIMINRSIEPLAEPMFIESFWIQFIPEVTVNIVGCHKNKKHKNVHEMDWEGKCKNINNAWVNYRFERTKREYRSGRWIDTFVVYQVKEIEQTGMMHHAVGKIKIRVMHD